MLRFRILASAIPLLAAGGLAGGHLAPAAQPCIQLSHLSVQLATAPWQSQQHVSFTDDPKAATVRIQIVDSPELADFAVVDDVDTVETASCSGSSDARYIGIAATSTSSEPVIYLSTEAGADYRIFVNSRTFTAREAAALVAGAAPARPHQLAASL